MLTTAQAAEIAHVRPSAITNWVKRGYLLATGERAYLPVADRDDRGRPLYRFLDVAKAERATRARARRQFQHAA
jgi:hypothetical protein